MAKRRKPLTEDEERLAEYGARLWIEVARNAIYSKVHNYKKDRWVLANEQDVDFMLDAGRLTMDHIFKDEHGIWVPLAAASHLNIRKPKEQS